MADTPSTEARQAAPHARWRRIDPVLALCALALLAYPLVLTLAAGGAPVVPRAPALPPLTGSDGKAARVADLPVMTAGTFEPGERVLDDAAGLERRIDRTVRERFPAADARRIEAWFAAARTVKPAPGFGPEDYPYRYAGLDQVLDRTVTRQAPEAQAWSDLAGLLVLASAAGSDRKNLGQVAFGILHRARAGGNCRAQLNLAFLAAGDHSTPDGVVRRELRAARDACPGDPTPGWVHGQWLSLFSSPGVAHAAFTELQRDLPRSAAGWAGKADQRLRGAYEAEARGRPFTARQRFRTALLLYRRARALDRDPLLAAGEARALAGLGEPHRAVPLDRSAWVAAGRSPQLLARLVRDLEEARRFGEAAEAVTGLLGPLRRPAAPALHFEPSARSHSETLARADAEEPLSIGAGRYRPAAFDIRPRNRSGDVLPLAIGDLSFLPDFRDDPFTRIEPWCASWSRVRDLVAAGRADEAALSEPAVVHPSKNRACGTLAQPRSAAVVHAEAGRRDAARRLLRRHPRIDDAVSAIAETRQNLWRFAGRLDRAAAITDEWLRMRPGDPLAADRAGEVAFLRRSYDEAARLFLRAARLARTEVRTWSVAEAENLVKAGVALVRAGREDDARDALLAGDEVATRVGKQAPEPGGYWAQDLINAGVTAYHARAQLGDLELRAGRHAEADEAYAAAAAVMPSGSEPQAIRPEALHGNHAVALTQLGRADEAAAHARKAVALDRHNPLSLATLGGALAAAGDHERAVRALGRAVREDHTLFPAWNDLGVALARAGHRDRAIAAFRRAVGARESYALGWFNLGVALGEGPLLDDVRAEAALARAARLDDRLSGRERRLRLDDHVYFVELDVSKPLPPRWSFAAGLPETPLPPAGLAVLVLLGLGVARGAAALPGGATRFLGAFKDLLARLPQALVGFGSAAAAILATLAVFTWPAVRDGAPSPLSVASLLAGLVLVVVMIARVRVLAARRAGVRLHQRSWRPAIGLAAFGAAVGAPWAPLPVANTNRPAPRVNWAGPLTAATVGLALVGLGTWLHVPATLATGAAAIAMAAAMLTPLQPLDGGRLGGAGPTAAGFGLLAVAVLALLQLG